MTIRHVDVALAVNHNIGGGIEMALIVTRFPECSERHQHFALGTEFVGNVSAAIALRYCVVSHRIGHPDVAIRIHLQPVRPDEQALAHAEYDFSGGNFDLHYGIKVRVEAFVPEMLRAGIASNNRPDVFAVNIEVQVACRAHLPAFRQNQPVLGNSIRIRESLGAGRRSESNSSDRETSHPDLSNPSFHLMQSPTFAIH